jgi:hypothetical protein
MWMSSKLNRRTDFPTAEYLVEEMAGVTYDTAGRCIVQLQLSLSDPSGRKLYVLHGAGWMVNSGFCSHHYHWIDLLEVLWPQILGGVKDIEQQKPADMRKMR